MVSDKHIRVTVVYSPGPRDVQEIKLGLPVASTVLQALQASGFLRRFASPDPAFVVSGVWGRKAGLSQTLRDNDRIEVYRPLRVDPKVARRERFTKQGTRMAGLFFKKRAGGKAGY